MMASDPALALRRTLTGAWIETFGRPCLRHRRLVAPSRVRGLKPFCSLQEPSCPGRTLTGAWIETSMSERLAGYTIVAPSRVRGLKPFRPSHIPDN